VAIRIGIIIQIDVANRHFFPFLYIIRPCHSERSEESPQVKTKLIKKDHFLKKSS
jgi:hypothetical protein